MMTKRTRIGIALAGWLWRWMGSSCLRDLLEKFGQTNHFLCNHIVLCYLLLICTIIATTITNNLKCIQYFTVEGGGGGRTLICWADYCRLNDRNGLSETKGSTRGDKWSLPEKGRLGVVVRWILYFLQLSCKSTGKMHWSRRRLKMIRYWWNAVLKRKQRDFIHKFLC